MGHCCQVLTFEPTATKAQIIAECNEWGNANSNYHECGGHGGLGGQIRFTDKIFDTEDDATEYLDHTFGDYRLTAVRFKRSLMTKTAKPTQKLLAARKKVQELESRYSMLSRKPHYAGVSSKTVGCKKCGSALATAYCGRSYVNNCPVCGADLRPPSTLEIIERTKVNLAQARKELQALEKSFAQKQSGGKYALCWAVACEVHC